MYWRRSCGAVLRDYNIGSSLELRKASIATVVMTHFSESETRGRRLLSFAADPRLVTAVLDGDAFVSTMRPWHVTCRRMYWRLSRGAVREYNFVSSIATVNMRLETLVSRRLSLASEAFASVCCRRIGEPA